MNMTSFQRSLENSVKTKLHLKINDNRSTLLSVKWEPDQTKVSMHRMFLDAPQSVMESLARYLRKEHKVIDHTIKSFIEDNMRRFDYSHLIDREKLYSQGYVYNLREIYDNLNEEYFDSKLDLSITWYGSAQKKNKSRVNFGLYYEPLKLIKINRLLDSPLFPEYVVSFVVYHEMVHHACPSYIDEKGIHRVHSKEFKAKEAKFKHFHLAQDWIKRHQSNFFV